MDFVLFLPGLTVLAVIVWKSKLSLGWKKIIVGFLGLAIIGNILILMTGHTPGYLLRQLIVR